MELPDPRGCWLDAVGTPKDTYQCCKLINHCVKAAAQEGKICDCSYQAQYGKYRDSWRYWLRNLLGV